MNKARFARNTRDFVKGKTFSQFSKINFVFDYHTFNFLRSFGFVHVRKPLDADAS